MTASKAKSGEHTIKDALAKAVYHYLDCLYTISQPKKPSKKSFKGRKPLHLIPILTKTTVHPSEKSDKWSIDTLESTSTHNYITHILYPYDSTIS